MLHLAQFMGTKKYPVKESYKLNPKNIYAQTKVLNENISYDLNQNNTKIIGLRFFTVYGEWGDQICL